MKRLFSPIHSLYLKYKTAGNPLEGNPQFANLATLGKEAHLKIYGVADLGY